MPWLHSLWTPLRTSVLSIPRRCVVVIPSLGGSNWFVTMAGLLLTWIARGMSRYPGQRNPNVAYVPICSYVAFISEIAAFELKALFLTGAVITAIYFVVTITPVHVVRYEPGLEWIVAFSGSAYLWLFCGFPVSGNFEGSSAAGRGPRARARDSSGLMSKSNGL